MNYQAIKLPQGHLDPLKRFIVGLQKGCHKGKEQGSAVANGEEQGSSFSYTPKNSI